MQTFNSWFHFLLRTTCWRDQRWDGKNKKRGGGQGQKTCDVIHGRVRHACKGNQRLVWVSSRSYPPGKGTHDSHLRPSSSSKDGDAQRDLGHFGTYNNKRQRPSSGSNLPLLIECVTATFKARRELWSWMQAGLSLPARASLA